MKKSVLIMFHLLFWIFTALLLTLVFQVLLIAINLLETSTHVFKENLFTANLLALLFVLPVGAIIFYLSYFTLKYFITKLSRILWIAFGYILFTLIVSLPGYLASRGNHQSSMGFIEIIFSITLVVTPVLYFNVCGFLFRAFIEWITERQFKAEREKDKVSSQLELLKSTISPHFLFNTLNNIDIMIQKDAARASEYLNKLSDIMRFMLYETKDEQISFAKELAYIEKYIALQKIRTSNLDYVKFELLGDYENLFIEPMLFIPLIENAFKHAGNKKMDNAIRIKFNITKKQIDFECENSCSSQDRAIEKGGGLGNSLVQKRLALLYPGTHTFDTLSNNGFYKVNLSLIYK